MPPWLYDFQNDVVRRRGPGVITGAWKSGGMGWGLRMQAGDDKHQGTVLETPQL